MKKFILTICTVILIYFVLNTAYYRLGFYIDLAPNKPVTTFVKADADGIY